MHAYVNGYVCASTTLLHALRHCCWDFLSVFRRAQNAYVYVCACMHVCVYVHMYVYVYMYVYAYICIYMCIHTRVGVRMYSCRCISFICTVQSLYYMRVCIIGFFLTTACVYGRWLEVDFFSSLFMVNACCWRGRLCFGRGRDGGFVLYVSLFLRVLGWCVVVCLYTRVHIYKLLGYLMLAQV